MWEVSRETQRQQTNKNKDTKGKSQPLTPMAKAKSKECLNPSQINIEPYTEHVFNSVTFTSYFYGSHQKNHQDIPKDKKDSFKKQSKHLEPDSDMAEIWKVLDWEFNTQLLLVLHLDF